MIVIYIMEIVVYKLENNYINRMQPRQFIAFVASNPKLLIDGESEKDAIERLKYIIRNQIQGFETVKVVNISIEEIFSEEMTKEVIEG
jgi:hypothetical protein